MSNTNTGIFPYCNTRDQDVNFMCVRNIVDALDDRNDISEVDLGLMKMSISQIFMCV